MNKKIYPVILGAASLAVMGVLFFGERVGRYNISKNYNSDIGLTDKAAEARKINVKSVQLFQEPAEPYISV